MRVLGLEPRTYGLKGLGTAHNYLFPLCLHAFYYIKKHYLTIADSLLKVNRRHCREKTDVWVTYELAGTKQHPNREIPFADPSEECRRKLGFQKDVWLCKPLVTAPKKPISKELMNETALIRHYDTSVWERKQGF